MPNIPPESARTRGTPAEGSAVIVIPARNEEEFIGGLLHSIGLYGPPDAELIVVDNASTDSTGEIAREHGARVVRVPDRLFPGAARNLGVERSASCRSILIFLDADVEITPRWQAEWSAQVASFETNPMQITGAAYAISKHPSWLERAWFAPMRARKRSYVPGGNIVITRTLFTALGGFDARLETGEDVDLAVRARELGASVILNDGFQAHHEGFPKSLGPFLNRERWHGRGDLASLERLTRSRIVWATSAFILVHLLGMAFLLQAVITRRTLLPVEVCLAAIAALCLLGTRMALGDGIEWSRFGAAIVIMYVYYVGRSLSIWDAVWRVLVPRI